MKIGDFCLKKTEYSEEIYNEIISQSNCYRIVDEVEEISARETEHYRHSNKIKPECIIVKNNNFAGIFTLCSFTEEVHLHTTIHEEYKGLLFTDGTSAGINCNSFEGYPGGYRHYIRYSLEKR